MPSTLISTPYTGSVAWISALSTPVYGGELWESGRGIVLTVGLGRVWRLMIKFTPVEDSFMQGGLKESVARTRGLIDPRLKLVT